MNFWKWESVLETYSRTVKIINEEFFLSLTCLFVWFFYITLFSTIFKCQSIWPAFLGSPVLAALPHEQLTASSHEWSVTCVNRSFFPILEAFLNESRSVSQCHQWNLENSPQAKKINLVFRATFLKTSDRVGSVLCVFFFLRIET